MSKIYYETNRGDSIELESIEQAKMHIREQIPNCVFADEWDTYGVDDRRLLVWETEEDSINDAGANAVGEIVEMT